MSKCSVTGKRRWATDGAAQDALKAVRKHPRQTIPIRLYHCEHCKGFHVTSKPGHAGKGREITNKAFEQYLIK